jgi:hypothetical protein
MAFGFQPMQPPSPLQMPNVLGDLGANLANAQRGATEQANPAAFLSTAPTKPLFTTGDVKALYQKYMGTQAAPDAGATAAADAGAGATQTAGATAPTAGTAAAATGGGSTWAHIFSSILGAL